MKSYCSLWVVLFLNLFVFHGSAAVLYVSLNSTNPVPPYAGWSTAATNIQDAISASTNGDLVVVTNGIYAAGGKSMDGVITNRVSLDKAVTVQSVNGPAVTVIQGAWDPASTNGPGAVRCAWLTNNATLSGFTLRGGATRPYSPFGYPSTKGGGVWGNVTKTGISPSIHLATSATVTNCVIATNSAGESGGGAYGVNLNSCILIGNRTSGTGIGTSFGNGGGAEMCNLTASVVTGNFANANGGGADNSCATNCAFTKNRSILEGSGIFSGTAINCTFAGNLAGGYASQSGAVGNAALTNCIVWGNSTAAGGTYTNYYNSSFSYCDTDPLPPGAGNIDIDPQFIGYHLSETSPCIGGGTNVASGTDIDGQLWLNPPSIGCDEWLPAPVIAAQPSYQVNSPAYGLTFNVLAAGQQTSSYFWNKDGVLIQDDTHHSNSGTANPVITHFRPEDSGFYQVVVSNSFGMATSQVAQVVIHGVNVGGANPIPPYSTWATAATNIQDAINISVASDIVLVTNGVYATGGKVVSGGLTNRVAVDRPVLVTSANGYSTTVIQGAWDPVSTNGPLAARCAWLTNNAILYGFTLKNGATGTGNVIGASIDSGGGVFCASTNSVVADCVLTNNSSVFGGGIYGGTLNNSQVIGNLATSGGGAYNAMLNNCTVIENRATSLGSIQGGGTYNCAVYNSIVLYNNQNFYYDPGYSSPEYSYSCSFPLPSGVGNLDGNSTDPQFLDLIHISSTSPCRGAGSALYASGTDLDGEAWANPPSMGCDEVVLSNLVGPLSVSLIAFQTNVLVSTPAYPPPAHYANFQGNIIGRAAFVSWSFGDGPFVTNFGAACSHAWTNTGDYTITFTAYNTDNPAGVSTNTLIHVLLPDVPQLQSPLLATNGFQFQFAGEWNANYTIQYTTNLTSPVTWQTLQSIYWNFDNTVQVNDTSPTNASRFYRVLAQ